MVYHFSHKVCSIFHTVVQIELILTDVPGVAPRDTPAYSQQREPVAGSTPQKRQLSEDKNETKGNRIIVVSPQQAGRDEDGRSQKKVKQLLEDFEEEISCPMYVLLFPRPHIFKE